MADKKLLPGAVQLRAYIMRNYASVNAFAKLYGFDQSELNKLLLGQRTRVSVELAADLERATNGAVTWKMWLP